ncbi:hypothetical protein AAF712_015971 [Marasmius tenuissimus]|uniref:Uncharacterized protein n=1 Tax=Marasmius tenuissimus TaxID=585030 RepID=A0ABR2Z7S3_9AGAR
MDSSFMSGLSDSSSRPLLEYSGEGKLIHVGSSGDSSSAPELDIISNFKSDGFSDFELDLSCLSNPPSPLQEDIPLASSAHVGALELSPSLPLEPPLMSRRSPPTKSLPFFSSSPPNRDPTPSPKMTPLEMLKSSPDEPRNSWPLVKYVGRGTPIDPTRRIEWGHGSNNGDVPNEHGVLFSSGGSGRANSLDSAVRSSSQEWQHVAPSHNHSHTLSGPPRALSPLLQLTLDMSPLEPLPETSKLQVKGIESDPDEWTSVMDTVMKSSGSASGSGSTSGSGNADTSAGPSPPVPQKDKGAGESSAAAATPAAPQPTDFAMFGLDTAVDLGLGLGTGMNFFNLGLAPGTSDIGHGHSIHRASTTGRDSPSVYSTAPPTPEGLSPPESVAVNDDEKEKKERRDERPPEVRERRHNVDDDEEEESTAIIGTPTTGSAQYNAHEHHHRASQWWRKIFTQLRKLQLALRVSHRRRD